MRGGALCPRCEGFVWIRPPGVAAPQVVHLSASDLEQATSTCRTLFGGLTDEVIYVDPYMGPDTLTWLTLFRRTVPVRFLTSKVQDPDATLDTRLDMFRKGFLNVELRRLPGRELHSRYVISGNRFIQLGHSGQGAGRGESVVSDTGDAAHLHGQIRALRQEFEDKWARAEPI